MNKCDKAIAICSQAFHELTDELAKGQEMNANQNQLLPFRLHLEKIYLQLKSDQLPSKNNREFGMGRAIVDSWPLDSKLGNLLCSAEQAYRDA